MSNKVKIMTAILAVLFVAAIIKMIVSATIQWEIILAGVVGGGYGVKRMLDEKPIGFVLVGACIVLMIIALTGFNLNQIM